MFQTMCALKIYMSRGDIAQATSVWRRLFRKPLASHFIERALKFGITHASLSHGNMGFSQGAKLIASDLHEIPVASLPVCVELVAPKPMLEQFVLEHRKELTGMTLVMLEGVHVRSHLVEEAENSPGVRVEYLQVESAPAQRSHAGTAPDREPGVAVSHARATGLET